MIDLLKYIKEIGCWKIFRTEMYSLKVFYEKLKNLDQQELKTEDIVLTPFYIDNGKRYELYDYELSIKGIDKEINVESYTNIIFRNIAENEMPKELIEKNKIRFIPIKNNKVSKEKIVQYLEYILASQDIRDTISQIFEDFNIEKLYFEIF